MNTNLLSVVKQITADKGEAVLENPRQLKALFSDLAKDEPKPLRMAFGCCIETGAYKALKNAPDAAERASLKTSIAQRVRDEHGIDPALCAEALDILEAALFGAASAAGQSAPLAAPPADAASPPPAKQNAAPPPPSAPVCAGCGAELKANWKACPECGAPVQQAPVCAGCGAELKANWKACPVCGTPVQQTAAERPIPANMARVEGGTPVQQAAAERPVPAMVRVEGGTFRMGSNSGASDERPVHQVTVKGFYMGKYQVTQKEWAEVMGSNPSKFKGDDLPVETVSWMDAIEYCNKRSQKEGLKPCYQSGGEGVICDWSANGYRLPTEAEWEYAAKGGGRDIQEYEYSGGDSAYTTAWYGDNSGMRTHPVGTKAANSLGIYDLSGNVGEWCWDWYGAYSSGALDRFGAYSAQTDPRGAASGTRRVLRGGSWGSATAFVRSAYRYGSGPSYRDSDLGFRLVRP